MTDENAIQNAGEEAMVRLAVIIALLPFASAAWAADDDIVGTYRLISANRVILATVILKIPMVKTLLVS